MGHSAPDLFLRLNEWKVKAMKLSRRTLLASVSAAAAASALPALSFAADPAPTKGGVMTVQLGAEQRVLNPAMRASTSVFIVTGKIVEALVDLGADGSIVPVLATAWSSTPDGKAITFKLRQGVTWHDGKPFTAADVQYCAMELWKKQQNYGTQLHLYLDSVATPDPYTAVFNYSRPMPLDLMLRAMVDLGYVVPRHVYEGTTALDNPANTAPIGTGPFKFVEYQRGQYIVAERYADYWRKGFPYVDRIVWRFIKDKSAAAAALETEQVLLSSYNQLSLADMDRLSKDPRFIVSSRGNEGNIFNNTVEFNHRRKELADVRVRRAIAHAVDVEFFIENFLYGAGKRATGPIPMASKEFYPGGEFPYPFDRKKAEALLDEAGYKRGPDGNRFTLRMVPVQNAEDVPLFGTFIQQCLAEVGIKVELVQLDNAGALATIYKDWNFDLATGWHQYRGDPAISTTVWFRSGSPKGAPWTNQFGWQSDKIDALIDKAASEVEPVKRKALYAEFATEINQELPVWFAIERQFTSVASKKLKNHHNTPRWPSSSWYDLSL